MHAMLAQVAFMVTVLFGMGGRTATKAPPSHLAQVLLFGLRGIHVHLDRVPCRSSKGGRVLSRKPGIPCIHRTAPPFPFFLSATLTNSMVDIRHNGDQFFKHPSQPSSCY